VANLLNDIVIYIKVMSSAFIQFNKPFYFAGDTIEGHVYIYLSEPVNARDVIVKFKGWEVVRWIEERTLQEHERQNVQSHMIWERVRLFLVRTTTSEWTVQIVRMSILISSPSTST